MSDVNLNPYDQNENYQDCRSYTALRAKINIGETVRVVFSGKKRIRWAHGEVVGIYQSHVGVNVRLRTRYGEALVVRKSFMVDDVVKWKGSEVLNG